MLQLSTIKFLHQLNKNNNKPWFDENRKTYEAAKADFQKMVNEVIAQTAIFDEPIGLLTAKDCMFRINRDVRFSKDKSPYKTNFGASINKGGKKVSNAGYYLHIEPGKSFAAGGWYMPMPPELSKMRQEIDYNFDAFKSIVDNKNFKKVFDKVNGVESLSRPPKGYTEDNPAIEYLKMKSYIVSSPIADAELQEKNIVKKVAKIFETMKPFLDFLNTSVE